MSTKIFLGNVTASSIMMFVLLLLLGATPAQAESQLDAKVYMTYSDFAAGHAVSLDSLTGGRTHQICQIREEDYQFRIKTGDKEADNILKHQALVVEFGGQLYVNCRYLRCEGVPLDATNFTQAYRYDGNKLCVVSHWINTGAALAELATGVTAVVSPLPVAIPSAVTSGVIACNMDRLSSYRCYCLDSDANAKGKTEITRMDDAFMSRVLNDTPDLLSRYKSLDKKRQRQSAANILPFLKAKGLIQGL